MGCGGHCLPNAGPTPFTGGNLEELRHAILFHESVLPDDSQDPVRQSINETVTMLLRKDLVARIGSARDLRLQLERIATPATRDATTVHRASAVTTPRPRLTTLQQRLLGKYKFAVAAVVLLLLVIFAQRGVAATSCHIAALTLLTSPLSLGRYSKLIVGFLSHSA